MTVSIVLLTVLALVITAIVAYSVRRYRRRLKDHRAEVHIPPAPFGASDGPFGNTRV